MKNCTRTALELHSNCTEMIRLNWSRLRIEFVQSEGSFLNMVILERFVVGGFDDDMNWSAGGDYKCVIDVNMAMMCKARRGLSNCGLEMIIQCAFNFQPNALPIGLFWTHFLSHSQIDQSNNQIQFIRLPTNFRALSEHFQSSYCLIAPISRLQINFRAISVQFQSSYCQIALISRLQSNFRALSEQFLSNCSDFSGSEQFQGSFKQMFETNKRQFEKNWHNAQRSSIVSIQIVSKIS